ncbi:hypothetical protein [Candidatus Solirubrobacter pratensis]|uniref:hypothetical protein n=1 Tax=Candidatus Solirubrobacter pratensis TaxID=1298857 RepID=UPI0004238413|nr:hypothetical protein [Candidatus Solirubrobacter pratensis]
MLTLLAAAAFDAGLPGARRRLHEALDEVRDPAGRVDVLTRLAGLDRAGDPGLLELLERELATAADPAARFALEAAALDALLALPGRQAERARRAAAVETCPGPRTRCSRA